MKKKRRTQPAGKTVRSNQKFSYPDNDPEWEHLEERYSQINEDMRRLADLIPGE